MKYFSFGEKKMLLKTCITVYKGSNNFNLLLMLITYIQLISLVFWLMHQSMFPPEASVNYPERKSQFSKFGIELGAQQLNACFLFFSRWRLSTQYLQLWVIMNLFPLVWAIPFHIYLKPTDLMFLKFMRNSLEMVLPPHHWFLPLADYMQ